MLELFPGSYAWSQAALRAIFTGGSTGEVLHVVAALSGGGGRDPEAWHREWHRMSERCAERADSAQERGHRLTASSSWRRAAIYAQWATAFLPTADPRRTAGHRRSLDLFGEHARTSRPPIERVEVPYEDGSYPAWFVRPPSGNPAPCAIYLPGWDSTKEQGVGLAGALAERGIATLLCDGPGVGEAIMFRRMPNRHDAEVPGRAALEWLLDEPRVDPARIAVVGASLGGYRAARFAAFEPRLAAAVIWGAVWDFGRLWRRQLERPGSSLPTTHDHALQVMGAATLDEVTERLATWTLEGVAERITCPLLILHGGADSQVPPGDAQQLHEAAGSVHKTLRIFPAGEVGSAHCQNDDRDLAHEEIGDWLADVLAGGGR